MHKLTDSFLRVKTICRDSRDDAEHKPRAERLLSPSNPHSEVQLGTSETEDAHTPDVKQYRLRDRASDQRERRHGRGQVKSAPFEVPRYPYSARLLLLVRSACTAVPDADITKVADAIVKAVGTPFGERPFRVHVDPANDGAEVVNGVADLVRTELLRNMGLGDLLHPTAQGTTRNRLG